MLQTDNADTATKPVAVESEKAVKKKMPKPPTKNRIPIPQSSASFTNSLSSKNHSGPGKELKERAYLLMQAFKPGLDDSLDAERDRV